MHHENYKPTSKNEERIHLAVMVILLALAGFGFLWLWFTT